MGRDYRALTHHSFFRSGGRSANSPRTKIPGELVSVWQFFLIYSFWRNDCETRYRCLHSNRRCLGRRSTSKVQKNEAKNYRIYCCKLCATLEGRGILHSNTSHSVEAQVSATVYWPRQPQSASSSARKKVKGKHRLLCILTVTGHMSVAGKAKLLLTRIIWKLANRRM